jgi:hypothetical protein
MKRKQFALTLLAALFLLHPSAGPAQEGAAPCAVAITNVRSGQEVGKDLMVEGTVTLPPGHHLWVFARRSDFHPRWWPQHEGLPGPEAGTWQVNAAFGEPRDISWEFDLIAAVFAPAQHLEVERHVDTASERGYPPMKMPAAACVSKILKVKKTSHQ